MLAEAEEGVPPQVWDELPLGRRPHSRLCDLPPVGVGSPMVESLTSYITRLAEAHSVAPITLVTHEILPQAHAREVQADGKWVYRQWSSLLRASALLNGVSGETENWVGALEYLTGRGDLRFLTLLTFAKVLPPRSLLRRRRAWCPLCYQRWRESNLVVYEPLLWHLECVTVCGHHHLPLSQNCPNPNCCATLLPLEPTMLPGSCPQCHRWMGHGKPVTEPVAKQAWPWHLWVEQTVGELLSSQPTLSVSPSRERIATTLATYLERGLDGKKTELGRRLNRNLRSIRDWLAGKQLPHLGNLLRICCLFETTPLRFFTEKAQERIGAERPLAPRSLPPERTRRHLRRFDAPAIKRALEEALLEEPAPPLRQVAKRLGYEASQVYKHLPDQCQAISQRYRAGLANNQQIRLQREREELRQAMRAFHNQGLYPGQRRLQKVLSKPAFFRDLRMRAAWEEVLQELGWKP